jgi:hypothetical protein
MLYLLASGVMPKQDISLLTIAVIVPLSCNTIPSRLSTIIGEAWLASTSARHQGWIIMRPELGQSGILIVCL